MVRDEILQRLRGRRGELRDFDVKSLALFGSAARGEATTTSDVDLVVEFEGPATFDGYMDLKFYLEELLGCRVDLVTRRALRPEMRDQVARESIRVA